MEIAITTPSTLVLNIEVEHTSVIVGPYARYAQKLLGVRAPLVAKEEAKIVSTDLSLAPDDYYLATPEKLMEKRCCGGVVTSKESLPINITSSGAQSAEEAAEDAADEIFRIRQLRRDLLTGDLGEGFFGGGLAAALDRLDFEESSLVELFMGSTERRRSNATYFVTLDGTTARYIVGRFSAESGVVADSDLTAEPILLQLTPAEQEQMETPKYTPKHKLIKFQIENRVKCDVYQSTTLLGSKNIPLLEFGYEYTYPVL